MHHANGHTKQRVEGREVLVNDGLFIALRKRAVGERCSSHKEQKLLSRPIDRYAGKCMKSHQTFRREKEH